MTSPQPAPGWYPDPSGGTTKMYWDGQQWTPNGAPATSGVAPYTQTQTPGSNAVQQPGAYAYKNPVLYALGGLFVPPLVLFLMGGDRKTCAIMLGLWVAFWLTVWLYGLGVIFVMANYIWSVTACYQEAVKQNLARGFA
jgi:hypothetical protein